MAKRDFTQVNPALAYISTEEAIETPQESTETEKEDPGKTTGKPPKGFKVNPQFIETKSKRINLLLQPSVVERVKKLAKKNKTSINETISQIIIEKLESEGF